MAGDVKPPMRANRTRLRLRNCTPARTDAASPLRQRLVQGEIMSTDFTR